MTKKSAKAFAPGAISSFFEILNTTPRRQTHSLTWNRLAQKAAVLDYKEASHKSHPQRSKKKQHPSLHKHSTSTRSKNNPKRNPNTAKPNKQEILTLPCEHQIDVPIGMGFGTSAGGALTAGLASRKP